MLISQFKASQIIADTATSIMKAYADLGPIAGSIAAALMGVTGVAQLSAANAERQRVKRMSLNGAGGSASASGTRVATGLESGGSIDVERRQDGKMFRAVTTLTNVDLSTNQPSSSEKVGMVIVRSGWLRMLLSRILP